MTDQDYQDFKVEKPAGGFLHLQSVDEIELYEKSKDRYLGDYGLSKTNDLVLLGVILMQGVLIHREEQVINRMKPEMEAGFPTGRYIFDDSIKDADVNRAIERLSAASEQIQKTEKALGIDKKTRESGGQHTTTDYLTNLKRAAREYGVHIAVRVKAYEAVVNDARWRLRLLRNGDDEDRAYHNLTPEKFCDWLDGELRRLEEVDKRFAHEKGRVWVGSL